MADVEGNYVGPTGAVITAGPEPCFQSSKVEELFARARPALESNQEYLFLTLTVTVYGHAALFHTGPDLTVLSLMDNYTTVQTFGECVVDELQYYFGLKEFKNAKLVVILEGNLKGEAHLLFTIIRQHYPFAYFPRDGTGFGFQVSMLMQREMVALFNVALHTKKIYLLPSCEHLHVSVRSLNQLREELIGYSKYTRLTDSAPPRDFYNGNNGGTTLAFLLLFAHYGWYRFMNGSWRKECDAPIIVQGGPGLGNSAKPMFEPDASLHEGEPMTMTDMMTLFPGLAEKVKAALDQESDDDEMPPLAYDEGHQEHADEVHALAEHFDHATTLDDAGDVQ